VVCRLACGSDPGLDSARLEKHNVKHITALSSGSGALPLMSSWQSETIYTPRTWVGDVVFESKKVNPLGAVRSCQKPDSAPRSESRH